MDTLDQTPTRRDVLATRLAERRAAAAAAAIAARPAGERPPLSFAQERLWFVEQLSPGTAAYVLPTAGRISGHLAPDALAEALRRVAARHEPLRSSFPEDESGLPTVRIAPAEDFSVPWETRDLTHLPAEAREAAAREAVETEAARPFDVARGPLLRALLLRLAPQDHVLALCQHHLVGDGWSGGLLVDELLTGYQDVLAGRPALPEPAVGYGDFARWQRERQETPRADAAAADWAARLHTVPPLDLPTDRPRPAVAGHDGSTHLFRLSDEARAAAHTLAAAGGATLYMTLLAAFQVVLHRWSGQRDFAVGSPFAGRPSEQIEDLIGLFSTVLPIRADLSAPDGVDPDGTPDFRTLLGRVRATALHAQAHQDTPLERIVERLDLPRDLSRPPLFQVSFALQNHRAVTPRAQGPDWRTFPFTGSGVHLDLGLYCTETPEGLDGFITYRTDLWDDATIGRLAGHFENALLAAAADPELPVERLQLLSDQETRRQLHEWNATGAARPVADTLDRAVADRSALTPDATALVHDGQALGYAELDRRANRIAHLLRAHGAGPDTLVGVCLDQGLDQAAALLGVLRAGAAYVPLDPEQPRERLGHMLTDSRPAVVVTVSTHRHLVERAGSPLLCLDTDRDRVDRAPATPPGHEAGPDHLAYVIYTSGSTGRPKGVAVQHRQVLTYLAGVRARFAEAGLEDGARYALLQSLAFDFGLTTLYLALTTGGTLHLLPARTGGRELAAALAEQRIDCVKLTPSHLQALTAEVDDPSELLPRKLLILGGEASGWEWAADLARLGATRGCRVVNHYGPTETTVGVTTHLVDPGRAPDSPTTPIGRPLPGARIYVLDRHLRPVPLGATGELWIGGDRLARGYLGQPELTAERFRPDPFAPPGRTTARMYRSGDLARQRVDGTVDYLGRGDQQVKIRGYRVELGEVEAHLAHLPGVSQAVADARGPAGGLSLIGYLVAADGAEHPPAAQLRAELAERLPDYLVPSRFVWLDTLPRQAHGKVDRRALPDPAAESGSTAAHRAPATPAEEAFAQVWADLLDLEQVGADDDFFDLGGHSLLAIRMVAAVRRRLPDATPLTLMDVFRERTLAAMAALAARPREEHGPRRLLHRLTPPAPPAGNRLTLVCLPYGGGSAVVYQPLADHLPPDVALHAVAVPGHDLALAEESLPLAEVARLCVEEIKETVHGPVAVYGHCGVGGALAVEVARLMEADALPLVGVYLGGIFPFARPTEGLLGLLSRFSALDRRRSGRLHLNWLRAMGADLEGLEPEQLTLLVHNIREDSRAAEAYFTERLAAGPIGVTAPVVSVIGSADPSTEFHRERHREWGFVGPTTAVAVLDRAGHYFLKHRAAELADIVTGTHEAVARGEEEHLGEDRRRRGAGWWLDGTHRAAPAADTADTRGDLRRFLAVATSQLVSQTGSALTEFALPLWIYLQTGSLGRFGLFAVLGIVPGLIAAPFAGDLVDRADRRKVLLASASVCGLAEAALVALAATGALRPWHVGVLIAVLSVALTGQRLGFQSAVPQLVPKRYLGHANGMLQVSGGIAQVVAPLAAVGLTAALGIGGVLAIDVVSYALAVTVLLVVRFPGRLPARRRETVGRELLAGLRLVSATRGFRSMLLFFAVLNLFLPVLFQLVPPLVLGYSTLGSVTAVSLAGGLGAVAGGTAMSVWGGPRHRRMRGMLLATPALGLFAALAGLRPDLLLTCLGIFGLSVALSLVNGIYLTIVQVKVAQRFHGRVMALNQLAAWSTLPIGYLLIAPLGTAALEPLLAPGGGLADTVGAVLGTGAGRGIGFLYVLLGAAIVALGLVALRSRTLGRFDTEVPDAQADDLVGLDELHSARR